MNSTLWYAGIVAVCGLAGISGAALHQDAPQRPAQVRQGPPEGWPDLATGLRNSPGCLGVDLGQFRSGKQSIFAWFEDKQAVKRWYSSDTHRQAMRSFAPTFGGGEALRWVSDDEGPILVIATLTWTGEAQFAEMPELPVSQISIELFKPLPGGAYLSGRLSPDSFKVDHMRDLTEAGN